MCCMMIVYMYKSLQINLLFCSVITRQYDSPVSRYNERYEQNEFSIMFDELNLPIINIEIFQAIKELKTNKSGGPDLYLNEY